MKKIIAFDLDGVVISSLVSDSVNREWFKLMSHLLGDPYVADMGKKADNIHEIIDVMERFTGLTRRESFDKNVMIHYAKNLYQLLFLAEMKKKGTEAFADGIMDVLIDLKKECRIALITNAPEDIVLPALNIGKVKSFDFVYRSPLNKEVSKSDLLKKFARDVGKPDLYVGSSGKDSEICSELKVKFALAKWGKHDSDAQAKFNLNSPKQLKGVIELL